MLHHVVACACALSHDHMSRSAHHGGRLIRYRASLRPVWLVRVQASDGIQCSSVSEVERIYTLAPQSQSVVQHPPQHLPERSSRS